MCSASKLTSSLVVMPMVGTIDIDIALAALLGFLLLLGGAGPITSEVMTEVAKRTASAQVLRREMLENFGECSRTRKGGVNGIEIKRYMCV